MSNELTTIDNLSYEETLALMGIDTSEGSGGDYMPQVRINMLDEDDDGNSIPKGTFKVALNGETWYAPKMQVRVFLNQFQYQVYDPDENAFTNKTVQFGSFKEEAIDEQGGIKCGRVKDDGNLSKEQQAINKAAQCYRIVYGQFRFLDATTAGGKSEDCLEFNGAWRTRGANFMPFDPILKQFVKTKRVPIEYWVDVELEKHKKGSTTYFVNVPSVDMTQTPSVPNADDIQLLSDIRELVKRENDQVKESHNKNLRNSDMGEKEVVDGLYEDLNDDLDDL